VPIKTDHHGPGTSWSWNAKEISSYNRQFARAIGMLPNFQQEVIRPMPTNPIEYIWPGIIAAQAIYTATKLRIPDLLSSGPKTVAELASDCDAHPATLERLLRALTSIRAYP
jgi:Dimerisation domain